MNSELVDLDQLDRLMILILEKLEMAVMSYTDATPPKARLRKYQDSEAV